MSSAWPLVALGEVLELKVDAVPVDALSTSPVRSSKAGKADEVCFVPTNKL